MEPISDSNSKKTEILCCQCGLLIKSNPANMCVSCIRVHVDIAEDIPKQGHLYFCKFCERYLEPPSHWIHCSLQSQELLSLCLKRLKSLNKVCLIDACFCWTEPHSKRIKLKLSIQKEVFGGAVLQQEFIVEFIVNHQMCNECRRFEAKDYWNTVVQIRQKVDHKKTFYFLEQLILKHKMHEHALNIIAVADGIDCYFGLETLAKKFLEFLLSVIPCKYQTSKKLKSHDVHNNTYNYKHSFSVEIAPVCKEDLVCLSTKLAQSLGGISQLSIIYRISSNIHLIDPFTAQVAEVNCSSYWHDPFYSICIYKQLQKYIVVEVEILTEDSINHFVGQGMISLKVYQ